MDRATRVSRRYPEGETHRERIITAARELFGARGFHATTTAELAEKAAVSMGQIYRLFASKDDIVLTIVEENVRSRVQEMHTIFDAVECGEQTLFDAIRAIAYASLTGNDGGLSFEILAEACRNPLVAERLEKLTIFYRDGIRRLATIARPDLHPKELNAYGDIMMACFIGLGHRTALPPSDDVVETSDTTASIMMQTLTSLNVDK